jgi:hypothetical protein
MKKVYLGDSVYAEIDNLGRLVLTTENGFGPSNTIILEPEVLANLQIFFDNLATRKNKTP